MMILYVYNHDLFEMVVHILWIQAQGNKKVVKS